MDNNQTKIIELLREVHLIAFKEIERLNLRIAELATQDRSPIMKPSGNPRAGDHPIGNPPPSAEQPVIEIMNESSLRVLPQYQHRNRAPMAALS